MCEPFLIYSFTAESAEFSIIFLYCQVQYTLIFCENFFIMVFQEKNSPQSVTAYLITVDLDLATQHSLRLGRIILRESLKLANHSKSGFQMVSRC
jgi:hypothetical protein